MYGTMGVGESEIGDPLNKIKIAEVGRPPKMGQKGKKSKEGYKEDSRCKKDRERLPS